VGAVVRVLTTDNGETVAGGDHDGSEGLSGEPGKSAAVLFEIDTLPANNFGYRFCHV
jgi:hypothetical protein